MPTQQMDMLLDLLAFSNSVEVGFMVIDMQSRVTCCNRAFCELFGFDDVADAIGYDLNELIAPGQPNPHRSDMTPFVLAGRSTPILTAGVVRGVTRDGEEFDVNVYNRIMFRRGEIARGAAFVERCRDAARSR